MSRPGFDVEPMRERAAIVYVSQFDRFFFVNIFRCTCRFQIRHFEQRPINLSRPWAHYLTYIPIKLSLSASIWTEQVVVGATPPSASLKGNTPIEVADRMADFLRVHSAMTGLPDIIVVGS